MALRAQPRLGGQLAGGGGELEAAQQVVSDLVMQLGSWGMSGEFLLPVLNARSVLMILGDLIVGWQLMEAALIAKRKLDEIIKKASGAAPEKLAADNEEAAFYLGKIASAQYFTLNILPTLSGRAAAIKLGDRTPAQVPDACFESK